MLVAAAAAYGALVLLILPRGIVALDDDFGYLRSVVLTLQHGRPWTDDWLEPWSAGFSTLAAIIFKTTGSFYCACYGLLGILAAVSFFATCQLLVSRGIKGRRVIGLAFLGLTFPTVLWKSVEFTGVALYVPCLLLALLLAEKRRWGWFCLVWALALSTRQSALTWAVLPVAAVLQDVFKFGRKLRLWGWLVPSLTPALGIGFYQWVGHSMNQTHAQRVITDHMWAGWNWAQARTALLICGMMLVLAAGWGLTALRRGRADSLEYRKWPRIVAIVMVIAALALLFLNARDFIACDHPIFDTQVGGVYLKGVMALAAFGWVAGRCSFRPVALAGAFSAIAALTARGLIWDYYLIDVAVFGFFAVEPSRSATQIAPPRSPGPAWGLIASALLVIQLMFIGQLKARLDRGYAMCILGSRALSEGRIPASEVSFLPFGLMAWYFFPYYVQHEGANSADVGDFGRYLKQDTVDIAWRFSKLLRELPDHGGGLPADRHTAILGGRFGYCWFFSADVLLLHAPPERMRPSKSAYPTTYELPVFPTDDAGWRALVRRTFP